MKLRTLAFSGAMSLCAALGITAQTSAQNTQPIGASQTDPKAQANILDQYGRLPLSFEANDGQTDTRVKFLSRTNGYTLFLTGDEAVLALRGSKPDRNKAKVAGTTRKLQSDTAEFKTSGVLRMKLLHANPAAKVTGTDELPGTSNYFIGNDPAKWRTGIPTYAKVKYEAIYSGIDLVYYGNQQQLEYDFVVAPGADPRLIQFDVRGAKRVRRDEGGELVLKMDEGEIRWHAPVVYQEKDGTRQEIAVRYAITDKNRVGFEVAKYDASRPLYIDPLIYSTYLGGSNNEGARGIAVDLSGNAYVIGPTLSTDFPTTTGAFQVAVNGVNGVNAYAFVAKLNATGSALVYSTYLGGSTTTYGFGISVDDSGAAYVTGQTNSTDFPTTPGAFQTMCGGGCNVSDDAFVTKLNPSGSALVYSTYLGGGKDDYGLSIAMDASGDAYVTGGTRSPDFPITPGAFQTICGNCNNNGPGNPGTVFVTALNPTGSALVYSTYLGGSNKDEGEGIAVDASNNAYVVGLTNSTDFPSTPGAFRTAYGGNQDAFVSKLNPTGSGLFYSTYLGGNLYDQGYAIVVDAFGSAYVAGSTSSSDFPTTEGTLRATCSENQDAFVSKLNPSGSSLAYSTCLGGSAYDVGTAIAVDPAGNTFVTGFTASTDFPVTPGAFQATCGGGCSGGTDDAFLAKLNAAGSVLVYSSYLGGSNREHAFGLGLDGSGSAYVTGDTCSQDFPVSSGAFQTKYGGQGSACGGPGGDAFVVKFAPIGGDNTPPTTTAIPSPGPNTNGWNNTSVTVSLNATDNAGGSGVKQIQFSLSGAENTGLQTVVGNTASVTVSAEGITILTYFATDNAGNQETAKMLTVRIDQTPPVITGLPAPGCTIWPPNHKLVQVATLTATDTLSGLAPGSFSVTGTSNDPAKGQILITGGPDQFKVQLGADKGLTYTLTATASDLAGNTATLTATCTVPHDQGH